LEKSADNRLKAVLLPSRRPQRYLTPCHVHPDHSN
jgi:hypothetical protein